MRSFSCDIEDVNRLRDVGERWCERLKLPLSHLIDRLLAYKIDELKKLNLEPDYISIGWIVKAIKSADIVVCHLAMHHMVWQMVDAHERRKIVLSNYKIYKEITLNCLTR